MLKEGTDTSQGRGQVVSNINAVVAVADILKTTLGPRGQDKLIHDDQGVVISNDGATIIKRLDVVHPAAKMLVDISMSQDSEVGDGTTTVVLLAASFLNSLKALIEEGMHCQLVVKGVRMANEEIQKKLRSLAINIDKNDSGKVQEMLQRCAGTALNSKLISGQKAFFSKMAVDAVLHLDSECDLNLVGIKRVAGGSVTDSFLVEGVAFQKTFSYAGFEQQPKKFTDPKIALINCELELKSESEKAEIRISDPKQYQSIVDAEWKIIYNKLEKCVQSGAQIVLSKLPIGDLATQYFADRNMFCAGRVPEADLIRVARATGGIIQTSLNDLDATVLGTCASFEEKQVGAERFNFFTGCPHARAATILLRGGAEQFIAESERSLHDAIMIVKRALAHSSVVGGAGAIEMELSRHLKEYAKSISSKLQLVVGSIASALEVIPRQLAENAGFDAVDLMNALRTAHAAGNVWAGVDIENDGICDAIQSFVWEPTLVKINSIAAASEATCLILSVDETVRAPKPEQPQ